MTSSSKLNYIYDSNGINLTKEMMYEGERILFKNENIKYEDEKQNIERGTNVFFTNFRVICLSHRYVFDIPLCFISNHYIKRPFLKGSPYICVEIQNNVSLSTMCPRYITDNFSPSEIYNAKLLYPSYTMIKFKDKKADMDKSNEILDLAIKAKEFNLTFKKPQPPPEVINPSASVMSNNPNDKFAQPQQPQYSSSISGMGLGIARVTNLMKKKMEQQTQMIQGSFSDIQSFREKAKDMIELAQQIRAKINAHQGNKDANNNDQTLLNNVLSKIGFIDPVTKEVAGSEYYIKLAEQINDYFYDYFTKNPTIKVITLIDAYCIYNRARGGNTVSPKDMKQALDKFKSIANKIMVKNFNNEMIVLHTRDYSNQNILTMVTQFIGTKKGEDYVTSSELSKILNVKNVLLEKILIEDMLCSGYLLLDEYDLDVRYYLNKIKDYAI